MKNFTFGYARVSTQEQNLDRQLDALKRYGVEDVYCEKMTGTRKDRPELGSHWEHLRFYQYILIWLLKIVYEVIIYRMAFGQQYKSLPRNFIWVCVFIFPTINRSKTHEHSLASCCCDKPISNCIAFINSCSSISHQILDKIHLNIIDYSTSYVAFQIIINITCQKAKP